MNWTFCWLPFDSSSARRSAYSGILEAGQPGERVTPRDVGGHPVQRPVVDELIEDAHPRVETALLGQIAPRSPRDVLGRPAVPADRARRRRG